MGIVQIMNIGIRGLNAYETALDVAGQNIAHADEATFSRREVVFSESSNFVGVKVAEIRRIMDETAETNLQLSNSEFGAAEAYLTQFKYLEPTFDTDTFSITTYLNDAVASLRVLQSDGSNKLNRSLYMDKLNALATRFKDMSNEITSQFQNVNKSLTQIVGKSNDVMNRIAQINAQVQQDPTGQNPALLDERQALVHELATYFDFTTQTDPNGYLNINLSNGMSLVAGTRVTELTTMVDPGNSAYLTVGFKNGTANIPISDFIHGGQLAGWMNFRTDGLEESQRNLNRLALVFSETMNAQNKLGVDLNGTLGGNIFGEVNSASAVANRVFGNLNNTGTADIGVNITNASQLLATDYTLTIGPANSYTLTRLSDNTTTSGTISSTLPQTISLDGFSMTINSGTFNSGDQYTISPTYKAASSMVVSIPKDGAQLALGWPVTASANTGNRGKNQVFDISDVTDTTTSAFTTAGQLSPPIRIEFTDSTHYNILDDGTGLPVVAGGPFTYDPAVKNTLFPSSYNPGYQITLSGTMEAGDKFNVTYNSSPNGDSRNGKIMSDLYDSDETVMDGNGLTMSFTDTYNLITKDVARKTNTAQTEYDTKADILDRAEGWRHSISGVNLPDETMNLERFQQAYQANAQILQAARSVLDTVISMTRR